MFYSSDRNVIEEEILAAALPGMQAQKSFFYFYLGNYIAYYVVVITLNLRILCGQWESDFMKPESIDLLEAFVDPVVTHHPQEHTFPTLAQHELVILHQQGCVAISFQDLRGFFHYIL
ncbi:UPF0483 protein, partial [Sesbania bispinosa]